MFLMKRSWPGTSTRLARLPLGRTSSAYPGTMEMPLRCSSSRRSVSVPVMYLTSVVLPWSTCPAVPMVREILCPPSSPIRVSEGPDHGLLVTRKERPHVQPQPPLANTADHGRVRRAQVLGQGLRVDPTQPHGEGGDLVRWQRTPAAAGHGGGHVHLEARHVATQVLGEAGGLVFYVGGWSSYHSEGWEIHFFGAVQVGFQGRFEGSEAEFVGAEGAGEGMLAHGGDPTRSTHRYPRLRPAEELVPREDGEVGAIPEGLLHPGFFTHGQQCPAANIGYDRES